MRYLHIPTLLIHGALLLLAALTINDYPDAFLVAAFLGLAAQLLLSSRRIRTALPCHLFGCAVQFAAFNLDLIRVSSGSFGLGGGGFAELFYLLGLGISLVSEILIAVFRLKRQP